MAEYEGVDALLAAITDEPLPEGAREDAEFMAEHRSAAADLTLLREQLGLIGDALADAGKVSETDGAGAPGKAARARRPRRTGKRGPAGGPGKRSRHPRVLAVSLGTLAVAAVAAVVVGMSWLLAQGGGSALGGGSADSAKSDQRGSGEGSSLSAPGYLACARFVVEGRVRAVERVPGGGQDRVTLDVERSYKPAKGDDRVTFLMAEDSVPRLHEGEHALVAVRRHQETADQWTTGEKAIAEQRARILDALPASRGLTCKE
ncbi:hypothetical protein [Streptomyces sp. 142MFCol3.1]|uniref:hypothetical protein n=1 Tax=Streptomyces sp. 142MFCol3.1 TaxID=1172179 RepID=UPI00041F0443|nr:hypothetical protein [Streptomyces sp. 142MFCol3.1]